MLVINQHASIILDIRNLKIIIIIANIVITNMNNVKCI